MRQGGCERVRETYVVVTSLPVFRLPMIAATTSSASNCNNKEGSMVVSDDKSDGEGRGTTHRSRVCRGPYLCRGHGPCRGPCRVASLFLDHGLAHGRSLCLFLCQGHP